MKNLTSARQKGVKGVLEPPHQYLPVRISKNKSRGFMLLMSNFGGGYLDYIKCRCRRRYSGIEWTLVWVWSLFLYLDRWHWSQKPMFTSMSILG